MGKEEGLAGWLAEGVSGWCVVMTEGGGAAIQRENAPPIKIE